MRTQNHIDFVFRQLYRAPAPCEHAHATERSADACNGRMFNVRLTLLSAFVSRERMSVERVVINTAKLARLSYLGRSFTHLQSGFLCNARLNVFAL